MWWMLRNKNPSGQVYSLHVIVIKSVVVEWLPSHSRHLSLLFDLFHLITLKSYISLLRPHQLLPSIPCASSIFIFDSSSYYSYYYYYYFYYYYYYYFFLCYYYYYYYI